MIIVNFKNYKTGKNVLELAKKIEKHLPKAIVAVPPNIFGVSFISHKIKGFCAAC